MTPGTVIAGRYRVVRLLGRGGMGAVYEALDLQTDRTRALKLMLDHRVDDLDARARFAQEARLAGQIDSPFVVDVLDAGVAGDTGTPYLVMELLAGENLDQRLTRLGPRPAAEVVDHLAQVARALTHMHACSVVHRDLKPSNLFVETRDGTPPRIKVLDLGVAKVLSASGGDTTAIVGSFPYMAPEQILSAPLGPATDLYALGLIAFTLLAGSPYWTQPADETSIAFAMKIAEGPVGAATARARELGVDLPLAFDAWFARAAAKQPGRRFRSAREAVRALAGALGVAPPAWEPDEPEPPVSPDDETAELTPPRAPGPPTVTSTGEAKGEPSPKDGDDRPRGSRRRVAALALVTAGGIAFVAWSLWPQRAVPSLADTAASPLAGPHSVLACPILKVDGEVAEWGWLGAAAATIACERARVILGGLTSRTQVPAELLELRRGPAGADGPEPDDEPFGAVAARDRSLKSAQSFDAYLDGSVTRLGSGKLASSFRVDLALRRTNGSAVKAATGEAAALYEAVRTAMEPLVGADAIPIARAPDPTVADYARASDVGTMLRLLDLTLAQANNAGHFEAECAWFESPDAVDHTDLASFTRYWCSYTLGKNTATVVLPSATTSGARTARARVDHMVSSHDDPAALDELGARYRAESSAWGKSVIAATLSCLTQATSPDVALEWASRAVTDEPKNPTGEWCYPWGQLLALADDTSRKQRVTAEFRSWAPWDSYAWRFAARSTNDLARRLTYARRAYVLSPFDTTIAGELSDTLLRQGKAAAVEAIANRLGASSLPVHQLLKLLLTVRFDASEGRFGRALDTARAAMQPQPDDTGWSSAQRLELAWQAVEIANVLGRANELADLAVAAFVDPVRPRLDWASLDTERLITAICAYGSPRVAERCFTRLKELRPQGTAFADGARWFAAGEPGRAARAWRPLVRDSDGRIDLLAEAMVTAFSAAGDHDQASRIATRAEATAPLFDGANMAMARAAQASYARGDRSEARRLARIVLGAWTKADTRPPILDDMMRLAR